jgi:4-hydroxy-tetrahydrodipicolinate synthase
MPMLTHVSGVHAAILTPRDPLGTADEHALATLVRFLLNSGISSFAVNGATGEFCLTNPEELARILRSIVRAADGKAGILCGIGAPGTALAIEFASIALEHGADALLLPMPYFFPYSQQDLDLFCRTVASSTPLPILLYNLPQFSSGLDKETVLRLITEVPNIIGIKDSSGSLEILRHLTRHGIGASRIVGNDNALVPALCEGVCDGVISGVACAMPELILALYRELTDPNSPSFQSASLRLNEFIEQLDPLPTPWGIKWTVQARDVIPATFAQPVTPERLAQADQITIWLREWLPRALALEKIPIT